MKSTKQKVLHTIKKNVLVSRCLLKPFLKPLTLEEELSYLEACKKGDVLAKEILTLHNLRLVAHIIKKYQTPNDELDDLISIGTIGLIKAINTYNPDRGKRLGTYAAKCIENELLMYFRNKKKSSKEVSLYDPIGIDKEGNEIVHCIYEDAYDFSDGLFPVKKDGKWGYLKIVN